MPLLAVSDLRKRFNLEAGFFARHGRFVTAVDGVSFSIGENECYGLVGESGCGKTTTARLVVRMYEPDSGKIVFRGDGGEVDARALRGRGLRDYRSRVKYVFQDPARSLNPRMSVLEALTAGFPWSPAGAAFKRDAAARRAPRSGRAQTAKAALREKAAAALEEVGLSPADLDKRPSEFSGGQRQRISIARGLFTGPELLICDEVVSALDVSVQSRILNLLLDARERRMGEGRAMSFLFIAHDLKVACHFCDRIGVMHSGRLVEEAPAASLWRDCLHPYTRALFAAAGGARPGDARAPRSRVSADAEGENAGEAPRCAFAGRCPRAAGRCLAEEPPMAEVAPGPLARCHFPDA